MRFLALLLLAACATRTPAASPVPVSSGGFREHVEFLASDALEGREAGTRGYDAAAGYVAAQFERMGLEPAGTSGFYQDVPFHATWAEPEGMELLVGDTALTHGEDVVVFKTPRERETTVSAEAVFVGYGIHAPEFGHDDYATVDVSGKIVVTLLGFPKSKFPSEEGAHFASGYTKRAVAARFGAVGMVFVDTEATETVYPFASMLRSLGKMSLVWKTETGEPYDATPEILVAARVNSKNTQLLFEDAKQSYEAVREIAKTGAPEGFPLKRRLTISQRNRAESRSSANVVAVKRGTDLADEYVVITGHLDHLGIGAEIDGDGLYNGAMDNAAGIAAMLEAAQALVSVPTRRSVMFLAVTAEEKGLLGSEYFAKNPTVPIESIVANVNLDMPMLTYDFADVVAFGAEHSTLIDIVESALAAEGIGLSPDPFPEQTIFVRSDHYRFVQQGVPSVMLAGGVNSVAGEGQGLEAMLAFLKNHYHKPSDEVELVNFDVGAKFARVNFLILQALANADARPAWKDGDFFGTLYGR
ncbi:MAG: M28 family metallopeptidase [Myxococcota bacterium]